MEGVATRHEPQGVVSNVGVTAGGGGHEQQVVRGNGTDSTRITRWEKPRGAIRGTPRGVRGGVATPPYSILLASRIFAQSRCHVNESSVTSSPSPGMETEIIFHACPAFDSATARRLISSSRVNFRSDASIVRHLLLREKHFVEAVVERRSSRQHARPEKFLCRAILEPSLMHLKFASGRGKPIDDNGFE